MSLFRSVLLLWGFLFSFSALLVAQSEYKYSYIPKKVYENQLFPITVIETSSQKSHPKFTFDTQSSIQPLFKKPLVINNGNDRFYTFYFKAYKNDIKIPKLFIHSKSIDTAFSPQRISLVSLKKREDFCAVLAADMKIKNHQVSNYDESNHLVTLSIEAYEANLEDMRLNKVSEFGIEELKRKNAKVKADFYVVLPRKQDKLKFTYFNTIKKQYVFLEIPVKVVDTSVTTQSDLNPKKDSFEKLKKYTFIFLVIFFFLMFLLKKDFFYLILGVVSLITLLTFYKPLEKVCIKQGAPLHILPTNTSTISTKVEEKLETVHLGQHEEFWKIEYKEGIIGWIKDEDLCKN
ncbi:MAG: hypothetical protein U9O24_06855 [Campylobacterota bacterium]|nr:hypothetical protein [Campylobacterota bacterium]